MIHESSFRDPSGHLFYDESKLLRQVNKCYQKDYDFLMDSSLYDKLINSGLLVRHTELNNHHGFNAECYKILEPKPINFISYPYEWCFSQLKDAAIATMKIQIEALDFGMILKDSSAYNIQFHNGKPILIDTLSFEIYEEGKPWQAYRQFCQHFLAPLALMSYTDIRLNQLLKTYIDGIPLDLASKLIPYRTNLNISLLMHIHLHAKSQKKYNQKGTASKNIKIARANLKGLMQNLLSTILKLQCKDQKTEWGEYYSFTNYSDSSFIHKKEIISQFLENINPKSIWDLGANTGEFTDIASTKGINCIAFDVDPIAVDIHYNSIKSQQIENILPLMMDLTNPSPSIGWNNNERLGFKQRPLPDAVLALALIHHLAISNNLPLIKIASFFSELTNSLVIEFVPKSDSQVRKLLTSRNDIFINYNEESFEKEFKLFFNIIKKIKINESERTLYLMTKRTDS